MQRPNRFFILLLAYCVLIKVLPFALLHFGLDIQSDAVYPWSFTPLFAAGLFGVAFFRNMRWGFILPVLALLVGDVIIGGLIMMKYGAREGLAFAVYPSQAVNYLALVMACAVGLLPRLRENWGTVLTAAVCSPVLFYLVSNFGVWAFDIGIGYSRDLAGLTEAYVAGLPFLKHQLPSTLVASVLLFSPIGKQHLLQPERENAAQQSPAVLENA